ncbi:response regulator [Paenibacillus sp. UMB4589-SE434]|uniref:response regulator transcription factor n=1 Tax=Paenibacillus sp. UMB4589-SE434 TaxID=3046314 RepID=UPI00254EECA5|nr:response regulator [Paenibacillus sp. UMB4589-SE434]MDK8181782.1 response regulator [Paenibacillus sp. UMB4589-SE434]
MKLLIVEDEIRLLDNLARMSWDKHSIDMIGTARNGEEALLQIKRKQPDIMLMDIQMPGMDGLALARLVGCQYPHIKLIILSGHDNFNYAQTAIELGVFKYLLKPAGEMSILQAVMDAAHRVHNEFIERSNRVWLEQRWTQFLPVLNQHFYENLTYGHYIQEEIAAFKESLKLDIDVNASYALIILDIDLMERHEPGERMSSDQFMYLIKEMLPAATYYLCKDKQDCIVAIAKIEGNEDVRQELLHVHTTIEKLLSHITQCLQVSVSAGISAQVGRLHELYPLYVQASKALQHRILYGGGIAIPYVEPDIHAGAEASAPQQADKRLEMALNAADGELAMQAIADMWANLHASKASYEVIMEQLMYITGILTLFIRKHGWSVQEVVGSDFKYLHDLKLLTTPEQMYQVLQHSVNQIVSYSLCHGKKAVHKTVQDIMDLLDSDLEQDYTLHTVADRFYVNSSYLSRLFKQETGVSFSAYVLERKMERAKSALMDGAKVYDAASMIGYRDVSYFTKIFRKYWGVTPSRIKQ